MNKTQKEREEMREEFFKRFTYGGKTGIVAIEKSSFEVWNWIEKALQQKEEEVRREGITGETSDGYHTFNELYEFRKLYNAVLFNEWAKQDKYDVHKSWKHSDGELCFGGGWFIVVATLPDGDISNHYEEKDWDLFQCEERELAKEWDGHSAQDVAKRLKSLIK